MKPLSFAVILIVLSFSPMVSFTPAQSNNNLRWGVQVGDEIILVLQRKVVDPSYAQYFVQYAPFIMNVSEGQRVMANVTYLSAIPSYISASDQMPYSNCTLIRENDSTVVGRDLSMLALPTGDWEFMTGIGNYTGALGMTVINTQEEWGTVMEGSFTMFLIFTVSFHVEMRYDKTNGTLSLMQANVKLGGSTIIDIIFAKWRPDMETVLPADLQLLTIEVVSIVGVVCIASAYFLWRRHRHTLLAAPPVSP